MKKLLQMKAMLLLCALIVGSGSVWATTYKSYNGNTLDTSTTISSSNVSSGTAGRISWTGKSCTYSSSRVNIAANGSITFTASSGYVITKIVIESGSSTAYYGTWTSSPSVTPSSSSGTTTFEGLSANSVTVTTSTAFRCTSASSISVHYAVDATNYTISKSATNGTISTKVNSKEVTGAAEGATVAIEAAPNTGYSFSSWTVTTTEGGETVDVATSVTTNPTSFTMPNEAVTVSASFTKNSHNLDITTTNGTCTVSVDGDDWDGSSAIEYGATVSITATPNTGYAFHAWDCSYDGATATNNMLTFNMPDEDVLVNFEARLTHTVTFSVNGNTDRTATVYEGGSITFPEAVEEPTASQIPKTINGMTFVGWYGDTYSNASVAPSYVNTAATNMGDDDVTYYAVYADVEESESDDLKDCVKSQTLEYDTWSYSGSTTNKNGYRLFHSDSYIESAEFDLSKLMKVIVYGGTFGGGTYNSLTIGDGSNTWKDVTVSGSSETGVNTFTGGTALSGTNPLRVTSNSGTTSGNGTGIRISKVEIFVKGIIASYKNFTTTVSALPRPEITMADVEMTWGDMDKSVAPSATINEEAYEGSFTFTSSSPNLTVASDGKLTCDVPGNYTVTASIAATGSYQAAEKTCNVTVNKQDITLAFENSEVIKNVKDASHTQTATKTPNEYDGAITYAITSSTSTGAMVGESTGTVTFTKIGVITITATGAATDLYNSSNTSYTLYVKTNPTITVSDQTLAVGETYEPSITSTGAVTIVSDPVGMITTEGNVITAAAIGTATVTVSTAASDTYFAEEESFTLTINGPVASDTKQNTSSTTTFTDKDLNHSSGVVWTASKAANSFETQNPARGVQFGAGIGTFTLSTSAYTGNITKVSVFSSTNDSGNTMSVKVGSTDFKCSDETTVTLSGNNQTYDFVGEATGNIVISCNDKNKSIYFKSITVELYTNASVTIAASGYGTYCYEYPLTLANTDDYKAYIVTNVSENTVTFTNVTGDIKGGVPFILYGNKGTYDIALADASTTVPAGNMLKGTLAPTYVATVEGDYTNFGLSGGEFKKINNGIVPANKAYLPVLTSTLPASGRLSIVFEEEETGIKSMRDSGKFLDNTVYNLRGQRVAQPSKGLYIVNGRKVIVK